MRLIIGLGNPGKEYENTRHNVGFMAVDRLAQRHQINCDRTRFSALTGDGLIAGHRCMLIKPMTFMNRSGQSVQEAMHFYKVEADDILIIVDDVALPCGAIRLRPGGSAGGHNGLSDIENKIGTRQYPRLRIGIGAPGSVPGPKKQRDYVLGRIPKEQAEDIDIALVRACDCCECWLGDDIDRVMSRFNVREAE